jgi:hypothetical protein
MGIEFGEAIRHLSHWYQLGTGKMALFVLLGRPDIDEIIIPQVLFL